MTCGPEVMLAIVCAVVTRHSIPSEHLGPEHNQCHASRRTGEPDPEVVPAGEEEQAAYSGTSRYRMP